MHSSNAARAAVPCPAAPVCGDVSSAPHTHLHVLAQAREHITQASYREAYNLLMQATKLAHNQACPAEESRCLSHLAYAAAVLGHSEEAIETAMLASQLADASCDVQARLTALNYLGVALLWNGSHEGAEAVLAPAAELARCQGQPGQCWQPQLNRCFNEAYRLIGLRHMEQRRPDAGRLLQLMGALERGEHGPCPSPLTLGLWLWMRAVSATWQHGAAAAAAPVHELQQLCEQQPQLRLLPVMQQWMLAEIALAERQPDAALLAVKRMMELCERMQQHPLQRIALRLRCELHEAQGQTAEALACLRQLQLREHRLRQVSMAHRRDVATLRLELRQHKREVQSLRSDAAHLQRLSMEDALTGLANRRALEQRLAAALNGHGRPEEQATLYVSVVDVDEFKNVNDRHSHQVGDRVLQTLATLFQQQLRSQDIAGRWGGDEFVLAFWALDDLQARNVVARLRQAVHGHDWAQVAAGLCIGISLGLTRAGQQDTLDSLLRRSDLNMYRNKRSSAGAPDPSTDPEPTLW